MLSVPAVLVAAAVSAFAQSPDAVENSARAVLDRHCMACHGEAQMAALDMRERETLLKGGKSCPAVVPGKADTSLLYLAASHDGELKMPPGTARIADEELAALRNWINEEEWWRPPEHESIFSEEQRSFWSFQPIRDPKPPEVNDTEWAKTPLDRFILAKLEQKGLSPSPPADPCGQGCRQSRGLRFVVCPAGRIAGHYLQHRTAKSDGRYRGSVATNTRVCPGWQS